jgi:hypothetical protein
VRIALVLLGFFLCPLCRLRLLAVGWEPSFAIPRISRYIITEQNDKSHTHDTLLSTPLCGLFFFIPTMPLNFITDYLPYAEEFATSRYWFFKFLRSGNIRDLMFCNARQILWFVQLSRALGVGLFWEFCGQQVQFLALRISYVNLYIKFFFIAGSPSYAPWHSTVFR